MSTVFATPDNPGTHLEWSAQRTVRPPASVADTVAIPITHDWGPMGAEDGGTEPYQEFGDWEGVYGDSDTPGRDAVLGAFVGPGVEGRAGAGAVIPFRMDDGDAAASTHTFAAGATPMLKLTAIYKGTRGDRISALVESDPADPGTRDRLRILFDGVTVERYTYVKADIDAVVAAVNARSRLVVGLRLAAAALLTHIGATALAGGDDGEGVVMADYVAALGQLEYKPFSVLCTQDLTDSGTLAAIEGWVQTQDAQDRPVRAVFGGPDAEGLLHDDFLDKDVSTSVVAARVAGALAGAGDERSLTLCPFAGLSPVGASDIDAAIARSSAYDDPHVISLAAGAGIDQLHSAAQAGVTVFRQVESASADVAIARCVTSFTDDADPNRSLELFSDARVIAVLDLYVREMRQWGDENSIGLRVTDEGRAAVRAQGIAMNDARVDRGIFEAGSDVTDQPYFNTPTGVGPADGIPFEFGATITRTNNYLVGQGKVV